MCPICQQKRSGSTGYTDRAGQRRSGQQTERGRESEAVSGNEKEGVYEDGSKVLRARIDMASPNINMRDPVIYRVAHMTHHNTGDEWCIYPMYDFAHPIEDAMEGITHSICTLEFEDHRPLYDWVVRELNIPIRPNRSSLPRCI